MIVMTQRLEHEILEELPCFPTAEKHRSLLEERGKDWMPGEAELMESWFCAWLSPSPNSVIIVSFPVQLCEFPISPETFAVSLWRKHFPVALLQDRAW